MRESLNRLKERSAGHTAAQAAGMPHSPTGAPPADFFASIIQQPNARQTAEGEVRDIPISELHEFDGHIFTVEDGPDMNALVESLKSIGQLEPAIVRRRPAGGYELIAGHRRRRAHELAGIATMKCMIVDMDDDAAEQAMMESNKHRPFIAPSIRAKIYEHETRLYERRQGRRSDLTSASDLPKLRWRDEIGKNWGVSGETVRQYILLLQLTPPLLAAVDNSALLSANAGGDPNRLQMPLRAGVVLAEMDEAAQSDLTEYIEANEIVKISSAQADKLAALAAAADGLTQREMALILEAAGAKEVQRATRFPVPVTALRENASKYKNDLMLQEMIADTINRYVDEMEAREAEEK